MKEITPQVLSDIESIKLSLEALSNKGIPIIDTFAPITTVVNIVTTVFATAFGGWITLLLFKRQEKMRIREELKLSFYNKYEKLYNELNSYFEVYLLNLSSTEGSRIILNGAMEEYSEELEVKPISEVGTFKEYLQLDEHFSRTMKNLQDSAIEFQTKLINLDNYLAINSIYIPSHIECLTPEEHIKIMRMCNCSTKLNKIYNYIINGYKEKEFNLYLWKENVSEFKEEISKIDFKEMYEIQQKICNIDIKLKKYFIGEYFKKTRYEKIKSRF